MGNVFVFLSELNSPIESLNEMGIISITFRVLEGPIGVFAFSVSVIFGSALLPKTISCLLLLAVCVFCFVSHFLLGHVFIFAKYVIQVRFN